MNTEYSSPTQGKSFYPLLLISVSLIVTFIAQLTSISQARDSITSSQQKLTDFVTNNATKLDDQVDRSKKGEDVLQKLVMDVLELSKNNEGAKAVIQKYGIKQNANAAGSPAVPASGTP